MAAADQPSSQNITNVSGGDVVGRDKITQTTITEDVAYNVDGLENPYLSLISFTYEQKDIYAGRDDEIDDAVTRLTAPGEQQCCSLLQARAAAASRHSYRQTCYLAWKIGIAGAIIQTRCLSPGT